MTNVREFGAVGDGLRDDGVALLHAVEQGHGTLVFPRGTYRLTRPLVVDLDRSGPIGLLGGGGAARLLMDGPGPALKFVGTHDKTADPTGFEERVWARQRMPTVEGLEIVGNHDQADGIELEGTMQATLRGLLIRRCRHGIHLVKRNRNVLLADSHIHDGRGPAIGVYFDGVNLHQTIIVGCHISYCRHAGIKVERSEVRNLQITGCDIEYNHDVDNPESADVWIDAREGTVREGTIASNTIQAKGSPRGANIRIEGPSRPDSAGAGLWTITGNILQDQEVNLWLRSCRGVAVTGNSFASAYSRSILVENCRHIAIGTNTFDHNPDYTGPRIDGVRIVGSAGISMANLILEGCRAGSREEGAAIEVVSSREVTITGCQVLDPEYRALDLKDVGNLQVADCLLLDRRHPRVMLEAIRLRGRTPEGTANRIVNNLVGPGVAGGIQIEFPERVETSNRLLEPG